MAGERAESVAVAFVEFVAGFRSPCTQHFLPRTYVPRYASRRINAEN